MARYKPQSRPAPKASRAKPALGLAGVLVLFLSIGYALWLAVAYSNSTTSAWVPDHSFSRRIARDADGVPVRRPLLSNSILAFAEAAPGNAAPPGRISGSEFSRAFARLDRALQARGKAEPDQILAAANFQSNHRSGIQDVRPCPIAWNDGEPSLMLAEHGGAGLSLPATLNECASAVESLR